jgi:hypothetical protein
MKKTFTLCMTVAISLTFAACKKDVTSGLTFGTVDENATTNWIGAHVLKAADKKEILTASIRDNQGPDANLASSPTRVDKYPAIVTTSALYAMVGNRFSVGVVIASDAAPEYQKEEFLKAFFMKFDLSGMEKVTGDPLAPAALRNFLPKLQ